jgi:hypothetical protein
LLIFSEVRNRRRSMCCRVRDIARDASFDLQTDDFQSV